MMRTGISIFAILRLQGYDRLTTPRWLLITTIVALLAALSLWRLTVLMWRWWNRPIVSPKRLFRLLCDQHGLSHAERSLLQQIASEGTFDPNFLFIDPELWVSDRSTKGLEQPQQALFVKLFGDPPPTA
jgi:hypothetical protein